MSLPRTMSPSALRYPVITLLTLVLVPQVAWAQSADARRATEAQALFEQATAEMDAGQFASACKKLEEVTRLVPDGVGGKYALGECYEGLGKLASAWTQYSFAEQVASRLGQTERAEEAKAKADALKPKLATMTVLVPDALQKLGGLVVRRDGVELREPQWGTPMYVDAGRHDLVVTAPGYTTWTKHVEVLADGVALKSTVPENAIVPDPQAMKDSPVRLVPVVVAPPPPDRTWQRPAGIVSTGVGATTLVTSLILGGLALSNKNASNEPGRCDIETNQCDEAGLALRNRAWLFGNVSTGLFVAGAIVTVGGVLLWSTAPSKTPEKRASHFEPSIRIRISPQTLTMTGSF